MSDVDPAIRLKRALTDFTPRPTVYKGIQMRSRLEAGYAQWLDARRWKWTYEPRAFAGEDGQYLPDFRIEDVHNLVRGKTSHAYVEIKPHSRDLEAVFRRMEVIWDSEPDAHLFVQVPPPEVTKVYNLCTSPAVFCRFPIPGRDGQRPCGCTTALVWLWTMASHLGLRGPVVGAPLSIGDSAWTGEWWNVDQATPRAQRRADGF